MSTLGPNLGARTRAALVRQPGDQVKLTRSWWHADEPKPGDGLKTPTGRRYLITKVAGKTLTCTVLPRSGSRIPGRWFLWWWRPR